jgi:hypothetical protein
MTTKELILGTIGDFIPDFLYYDRTDDSELPRWVIEDAIERGLVTIPEMVERFELALKEGLLAYKNENDDPK